MSTFSIRSSSAFTLMEVITVLLLMGIVSAVAFTRMLAPTHAEAAGRAAVLMSHIRYAQMRALNTSSVWGVAVQDGGGGYYLFRYRQGQSPWDSRVAFVGEEDSLVSLPAGISISVSPATITFDGWGRPCTDTSGSTLQVGSRTVVVSGGDASSSFAILGNTGFLQ